jgi:hypothetical protein
LRCGFLSVGRASPRQSERPRSLLPHFIDHRVSNGRPGSTARDGSLPPAGWPMRSGHRLRHSSKSCNLRVKDDSFEDESFSSRGVDAKCLYRIPSSFGRGACPTPERARLSSDVRGRKGHGSDVVPLSTNVRSGPFRSLLVTFERLARSKNRSLRSRSKNRSSKASARTLVSSFRIRSEFGNRKLQEPRPRCRLFETNSSRERLCIWARATPFFARAVFEADSSRTR